MSKSSLKRRLRVGLIGGEGGFFGGPQQRGVFMDGTAQITCGALSSDPARALAAGDHWPYAIHCYPDCDTLIATEVGKPIGERIDYILIVTPNDSHYRAAVLALKAGIPVFCEKPLTLTVEEAEDLASLASQQNIPFAVAHTYHGHAMVHLAAHIVQTGLLGEIRIVESTYEQGWLSERLEDDEHAHQPGHKQAKWRTDPVHAGVSCAGGDIGTHAYHLVRQVVGHDLIRINYALLHTFVEGRKLDDHFQVEGFLSNGAAVSIRASQVKVGFGNDLNLRVFGTKGSLLWDQKESERLVIKLANKTIVYERGQVSSDDEFLGSVPSELLSMLTLPQAHCEGFHDALARLHREFGHDVHRFYDRLPPERAEIGYPGIRSGVAHMKFLRDAVAAAA